MINVTIGDNLNRIRKIVDENTTLRVVLEENGIDYTGSGVQLDGVTVGLGDLDKTFAELGVTDSCYLLRVAKLSNA